MNFFIEGIVFNKIKFFERGYKYLFQITFFEKKKRFLENYTYFFLKNMYFFFDLVLLNINNHNGGVATET